MASEKLDIGVQVQYSLVILGEYRQALFHRFMNVFNEESAAEAVARAGRPGRNPVFRACESAAQCFRCSPVVGLDLDSYC
jgi:hypothetical protein